MSSRALRAFVLLALLLGAAELACRFALGLGTPPLYVADPQIEYLMKPDQDVMRFGNHVRINHWGMRSDPFSARRTSPDELRVMVYGDSVINGGSQTDQALLATTRVQQQLAAQLKRPVTLGNISAGSWGPGNWRAYFSRFGSFDADITVLIVNSGDYADNPGFEPLQPSTHPTSPPVAALEEAVLRYLPRYLPASFRPAAAASSPARVAEVSDMPSAADVERGMADLRAFLLAAQASSRVVVIHHPDKTELATSFHPGHDAMKALCATLKIDFVELTPAYRRTMAPQDLYRDGIHVNEAGQAQIAAVLADAILQRLH